MKEGILYAATALALAMDGAAVGFLLVKAFGVPGSKKLLRKYGGKNEKDKTAAVSVIIGIIIIAINLILFMW